MTPGFMDADLYGLTLFFIVVIFFLGAVGLILLQDETTER